MNQKLLREIIRANNSVANWMRHLIRPSKSPGASAVMQNDDVFPEGEQYEAAKRLLAQYPTGITSPS